MAKGLPVGVLVDDDVRQWAEQLCWRILISRGHHRCVVHGSHRNGKHITKYLHREIMSARRGQIVDHINGNTMDNRRCNLRFVTQAENLSNRIQHHPRNTSGVRGVSWDKERQKWMARYGSNPIVNLGRFSNKTEAEMAVRDYRRKHTASMELV